MDRIYIGRNNTIVVNGVAKTLRTGDKVTICFNIFPGNVYVRTEKGSLFSVDERLLILPEERAVLLIFT